MTQLGLCVSPGFIPDASEIRALNPPFIRSIIYSLDGLVALKNTGLPILLTLNNQCKEVGGGWQGWSYTVAQISDFLGPQLLILECGNEFDLFWDRNHADVPPSFAADLVKQAAVILHPHNQKVSACSVASEHWYAYLQQTADLCRNEADYFNIHPYGQKPLSWKDGQWGFGDLSFTLTYAGQLAQKPIICSEEGVKIGDAGGPQMVASFLLQAAYTAEVVGIDYMSWFAWTDAVGASSERGDAAFGLRDETGIARPAWYAYQTLNVGTGVPIVEVSPVNLDRWRGKVGDGLLTMMLEDNTEPTMESEWRPFNRPANVPATIEQCIAINGVTYFWILSEQKGFRIRPS